MWDHSDGATLVIDTVADDPVAAVKTCSAGIEDLSSRRIQPRIQRDAEWILQRHRARWAMGWNERRFPGEPVHCRNVAVANRRMADRMTKGIVASIHKLGRCAAAESAEFPHVRACVPFG